MEVTKDTYAHSILPFCDGEAVSLEKYDLYNVIRRQINAYFALKPTADFPGAKPIGFRQKHLEDMKSRPDQFFVTEKTDGQRCWLFFVSSANYRQHYQIVIDARYNMRLVKFQVPKVFYEGTLLDGELVQEADDSTDCKTPSRRYTFLVFDALYACGTPLRKYRFSDRIKIANKIVERILPCPLKSPFHIQLKSFYPLREIACALDDLQRVLLESAKNEAPMKREFLEGEADEEASKVPKVPRYRHKVDGLIFYENQVNSRFHCPYTLKWKMFRDLSIDFLMAFLNDPDVALFYVADQNVPFAKQDLSDTYRPCTCKQTQQNIEFQCHPVLPYSHKDQHLQIIECFFCYEEKLYKPHRLRQDKPRPNSYFVAVDTVQIMS